MQHELQINTFARLIEQEKRNVKGYATTVKTLDSNVLAVKTIYSLTKFFKGNQKLTAFAGSLGEDILTGIENLNASEKSIRRTRVAVGLFIVRILCRQQILKRYFDETPKSKKSRFTNPNLQPQGEYCLKPKTDVVKVYRDYIIRGTRITKETEVTRSEFFDKLFKDFDTSQLSINKRPSYYKPKQRTSFNCIEGGKLVSNIPFSRIRDFNINKIPLVYEAINNVQSTEWLCNRRVLSVVNNLRDTTTLNFKNKRSSASSDTSSGVLTAEELSGKLRETNFIIDTANSVGSDNFYLYWYYGPRGRLYCRSEYFNPQGNKLAKSLFYFNSKRRLGDSTEVQIGDKVMTLTGWDALMMHTANCLGFDKLPILDRISIVEDNLELIQEVFADPEDNVWWWSGRPSTKHHHINTKSVDSPWESLAACLEIIDAIESGDEFNFESGLPVGIDATTSAFQFIAMILKNKHLASLCNLLQSDQIADAYDYVGSYVWENELDAFWASLESSRRKISKRSTMTFCYCCKAGTMGEHIYDDFKLEDGFEGLTKPLANAMGKELYNTCVDKFPAITEFMDLIQYIVGVLARNRADLKLTGPWSKFPFKQNYRKDVRDDIEYSDKKNSIILKYISNRGKTVRVGKAKQSGPANIVHSNDKELVLMTAVKFKNDAFTSVHDCFFTNPSSTWDLYTQTRDNYVEYGSMDLLGHILEDNNASDLRVDDVVSFKKTINRQLVDIHMKIQNDLDINELKANQYCIS